MVLKNTLKVLKYNNRHQQYYECVEPFSPQIALLSNGLSVVLYIADLRYGEWSSFAQTALAEAQYERSRRTDSNDLFRDNDPNNDPSNPNDTCDPRPRRDPGSANDDAANRDLPVLGPFLSPPTTPLVFDLDGDGVELIALSASVAQFDLKADGFAERTGWVNADDGILVLDRNANGVIDDGLELFGNAAGHAHGFAYLAELDSNGDGVINADDTLFGELQIWRDLNGDGLSDSSELFALSDYQISSISLGATASGTYREGHFISHTSTFQRSDGSIGTVEDVWFKVDSRTASKILASDFEITGEAMLHPILYGYGKVASTWVALSESATLLASSSNLLQQLQQGNVSGFLQGFEAFLLEWAGASNVNPTSAGPYIDARHLAFLEAMYGQKFNPAFSSLNPGMNQGAALGAHYSEIVETFATRFMAQSARSAVALGQLTDIADHPLFFLAPLALGLSPSNVELSGPPALALALAMNAIDANLISTEDVVSVFKLLRFDLDYSDLTTFGAELAASGLSLDREDLLAFDVSAGVASMAKLAGGHAADTLTASSAATAIHGRTGNDVINGGSKADWLIGGLGDDQMNGYQGNDIYFYVRGDGHDTIIETMNNGANDRLLLLGVDPDDVSLVRNGNHVTLVIAESAPGAGDNGSILLRDSLNDYFGQGVEQIVFDDGTSWNQANLRVKLLAQASTAGNDVINGFYNADTITGGLGDDQMNGQNGNDTYIYVRGDGHDTIIETMNNGANDRLLLQGIAPDDVSLVRNGNHVTLVIAESAPGAGDNGSILLTAQYNSSFGRGVEQFIFNDETSWNAAKLASHIILGTTGNDTLNGGMYGDYISGGNGHDLLNGHAGRDFIDGGAGNDTLVGGPGDDILIGGPGDDIFVFQNGDGNDRIEDFVAGPGSDDVIDVSAFELYAVNDILNSAIQTENDTILQLGAETTVRLVDVQLSQLHADDFLFALT